MEENNNPEAEQELNQEGTANDDTDTSDDESTGDPLDQISDVEALRHEAKKYRGIASRPRKDETPAAKVEESPYMTKRDFQLANEKKAKLTIRENAEIDQNFDAIMANYVSRRGKDTPEDIVEDFKDAYTVWKSRNPSSTSDAGASLQTITVAKPSGSAPKPQAPVDNDPRFKGPASPDTWYK